MMTVLPVVSFLLAVLWLPVATNAFGVVSSTATARPLATTTTVPILSPFPRRIFLCAKQIQDEDDDDEDEDHDHDDAMDDTVQSYREGSSKSKIELDKIGDATRAKWVNPDGSPKLGIDLKLAPLSDKEADELKAAAMEIINDGIAEGMDEIASMREDLNSFVEKQRQQMELKSDLKLQKEEKRLLNKIDQLTDEFLTKSKVQRESTKRAARADQSNEGQGVEVGVWGVLNGAAVTTDAATTPSSTLLGSVSAARQSIAVANMKPGLPSDNLNLLEQERISKQQNAPTEPSTTQTPQQRVIMLADTSNQDPMAKQLVPALTDLLQQEIPALHGCIDVWKPTDTVPLGGNNAACAVIFCTSYNDRSTLQNALDRLLRKTMQSDGSIGTPPTQLVAISTLGTERTDKMPYSMANLLSGGKLEQRRQVEETIMNTVLNRDGGTPLDYTIVKLGDLKPSKEPFTLQPYDSLDGTTPVDTAAQVVLQALAYQPYARNATLAAIGTLPTTTNNNHLDELWDAAFLTLDGPELMGHRYTTNIGDAAGLYDRLEEYLVEWAQLLAANPKGLTTPVRVERSPDNTPSLTPHDGVVARTGVQLLFLPTNTGTKYMSKDEEREREQMGQRTTSSSNTMSSRRIMAAKEGGVEVVVESIKDGSLRVRVKRCNYAPGVPLKELTEETILSRLDKAMQVWQKEIQQQG